jgi:nucleotide-binding universal stress UspA family protein
VHPFTEAAPLVRLGDLIMQAGRPTLIVPPQVKTLALEHVLLAWKDGSPARRAAADSLPLLQAARRVTVAEVTPHNQHDDAEKRLRAVGAWLKRHDVQAEAEVVSASGDDATRLEALAHDWGIDLVVAGAYAHTRMQEWMFGGVTRSLLGQKERCTLVSH